MRKSNGCWTCRLRRKKCDESYPTCNACAALHITCHNDPNDRPSWMDSGARQKEVYEQLKRKIKERARRRREEHTEAGTSDLPSVSQPTTTEWTPSSGNNSTIMINPVETLLDFNTASATRTGGMEPFPALKWSDVVLLQFYLEHLLPFLFPFYQPSPLHGGTAWMLEMILCRPVIRQSILCQSAYWFSLAQGMGGCDTLWKTAVEETQDALRMLRQALQVLDSSGIVEHPPCAVRVIASIMQLQRFEITISSFDGCQAHLDAAVAVFRKLLGSPDIVRGAGLSPFETVMSRLGTLSWKSTSRLGNVPSAEQAAFRFSSTLLILDDIVASTVLQEQPKLYEHYHSLLAASDGADAAIDLEAVVGCQNWALLQVAEIAVLDGWKKQCNRAGNLDVMELVRRAAAIKDVLEIGIEQLEANTTTVSDKVCDPRNIFTVSPQSKPPARHTSLVTRVWAHAALIYLAVVVSGWQPASSDVRFQARQVLELLTTELSPSELLRTTVWPFCVAGCLAEPSQETQFRMLVEGLQPPSVFGSIRKALKIMQNVWARRQAGEAAPCDLAACFRSEGGLVLLV